MSTPEPHACAAMVAGEWRSRPCQKAARTERDGKWYCAAHDPVKVADKRAARDAAYTARSNASIENRRIAGDLLTRVKAITGVWPIGSPHFSAMTGGCDGRVVLEAAALEALLVRAESAVGSMEVQP